MVDEPTKKIMLLLVGGVVALGVALLVLGSLLVSQEPAAAPGPAKAPALAADRPTPGPDARSDQSDPPERSARQTSRRLPTGLRNRRISAETRRIMLAAILTRIAERKARQEEAQAKTPSQNPLDLGLSMDYIREQIHEIVPLVEECYEMALENDPDLAGTIAVRFTIVGDEEYGGLVKKSRVLEESSMASNADMVECVRETMYA
ncbi:MAG: hypothetical protein ABI333_09270, partial [bacterium]